MKTSVIEKIKNLIEYVIYKIFPGLIPGKRRKKLDEFNPIFKKSFSLKTRILMILNGFTTFKSFAL